MKKLAIFQKEINRTIISYLDEKIIAQQKIDEKAGILTCVIKEFVQMGGKKFRPALFYFTCKDYAKQTDELLLRYAMIFEFIHTFALIHDDIIDHAILRRGNKTIHTKYGIGTAILAANMALMYADELFLEMQNILDEDIKKETHIIFNLFKQELMVGQYLDTIHVPRYETIISLKTSRYSFVRPVEIAFLVSDSSKLLGNECLKILFEMGELFQMKDDYEGLFGKEEKTGKSVTSDVKEGKFTCFVENFLHVANLKEKNRFNSFFGVNHLSNADFTWYLETLKKKGIELKIKNQILSQGRELKHKLDRLKDGNLKELAMELLELMLVFV